MTVFSNDGKTSFPHKLLLNDTQVSRTYKAFPNSSSANIKLSKRQLSKMLQLRGMGFFDFLAAPRMLLRNETIKSEQKRKVME